jgi:biotin-dependent carboxylase-like uncharacterized protein
VGNTVAAAAVEALFGSLVLEAVEDAVVAVTGALCEVSVGSRTEGMNVSLQLRPGDPLRCGTPTRGLRVYVTVRGGFAPPPVLGSRSYDGLGQIGPSPLAGGDELAVGRDVEGPIWWEPVAVAPPAAGPVLRLLRGPRDDWASAAALTLLTSSVWTVLPASNRTGLRLSGPVLARRVGELPSEPTLPGALQLPADGQPILLGPDSGTTGGYPVLGVVCDEDLDHAGQAAPGTGLQFRWK